MGPMNHGLIERKSGFTIVVVYSRTKKLLWTTVKLGIKFGSEIFFILHLFKLLTFV
jgi:hypothetical protein